MGLLLALEEALLLQPVLEWGLGLHLLQARAPCYRKPHSNTFFSEFGQAFLFMVLIQ